MKKLLLLGGAQYLLPVIEEAHKLGLYVITCDYLPDNIAHKHSDEYRNVSIIDKDAVLSTARELGIDDADKSAYHVWLRDEDGIEAYARVLPAGVAFPTAAFGRVIAVKRRCGLGTKIVAAAIETARDKLGADVITIEAQVYARSLYENLGFRQTSEEFLEDGIPHIQMQLEL